MALWTKRHYKPKSLPSLRMSVDLLQNAIRELWGCSFPSNERNPQTHTAPDCWLTEGYPDTVSRLSWGLTSCSCQLGLASTSKRRLKKFLAYLWWGLGATKWKHFTRGRVSWDQSTWSRSMHLVQCTPLVADYFLVLGPLVLLSVGRLLIAAGLVCRNLIRTLARLSEGGNCDSWHLRFCRRQRTMGIPPGAEAKAYNIQRRSAVRLPRIKQIWMRLSYVWYALLSRRFSLIGEWMPHSDLQRQSLALRNMTEIYRYRLMSISPLR